MLLRILLLCLALGASPFVHAQLPPEVSEALRAARIPENAVGVVVQPVDAARPLIEHNARQAMNPASVMKLVTTYAGLDLLGPAWTWQTGAWADTPAVDGVLRGNLYLKGSGDPRLAIQDIWALLRKLRVRGVDRIAGDIVLDRSAFQPIAFDPAAFDNKPQRPYNVGPSALLLNFQALSFTLQPAEGGVRVWLETPSEGLQFDNRLRLTPGACGSDWKDRISIRVQPGPRLEMLGTYGEQCGEKALNLAPLAPEHQADGLLRALWRELGGQFDGRVRDGRTPERATLLARHESATLADIVRDINKYSNNVMARQLFLTLSGDGAPASTERAGRRLQEWLAGRGLNFPELVIDNGSGLSRSERIATGSLNRLLLDAWRNPVMPELVSSLPLAGVDGTMKKRLNGAPALGRAHIKTGTLDGVKSAAGYALDGAGRRYAVSFVINDPKASAGGPAIDALLNWIARRTN